MLGIPDNPVLGLCSAYLTTQEAAVCLMLPALVQQVQGAIQWLLACGPCGPSKALTTMPTETAPNYTYTPWVSHTGARAADAATAADVAAARQCQSPD